MEQQLDKVLNDIVAQPETIGCLLANRQGLCLGAKGKINTNMCGIGMAISEQACKLEPNSNPPTICLYSGNNSVHSCAIPSNSHRFVDSAKDTPGQRASWLFME